MKEYSKTQMENIYSERIKKLALYLSDNNIGSCVFIDNEEHRDPAVPYFSGHPSDAVLIIFSDCYSVLIPWDEFLAKQEACYSKLVPFTRFKCKQYDAVKSVLNVSSSHGLNSKVELPPYLTYPEYLHFVDVLSNYNCRCSENGAHLFVTELRMVKDDYEIECTKEAARIGDIIIDEIEAGVRNGEICTETDVALLIEKECRKYGCQRTGFDTLAAGPSRSFAIHAFPGYTAAAWPGDGLSILDFGVVYNGYTSDTTLTIAKNINEEQEKLLSLVQQAYDECLPLYKKDLSVVDAAKKADAVFAKAKRKMPHTLGHAIGLEIHEKPRVSSRLETPVLFKSGMICTLEPGLYDPELGGVRLENDVLITDSGNEVLTHSRIIRL